MESSDLSESQQVTMLDAQALDQYSWKDSHLQLVHGIDKKFRVTIESKYFSIRSEIYALASRRIAVADYLLRKFPATIEIILSSGNYVSISYPSIDQFILRRSCINIFANNGNVCIYFKVLKGSTEEARQYLLESLPPLLLRWISCSDMDAPEATAHWQNSEDQDALRKMVSAVGVAFVADGSILPRAGMEYSWICSQQINCTRCVLSTLERQCSGKKDILTVSPRIERNSHRNKRLIISYKHCIC